MGLHQKGQETLGVSLRFSLSRVDLLSFPRHTHPGLWAGTGETHGCGWGHPLPYSEGQRRCREGGPGCVLTGGMGRENSPLSR